ncbi:hypothetical protein N0V82_000639 [Gnomoniopsis sp. IMI 355080]|nr:hypothetical protein N0V82_000639 [Gnomoniopsis sp. IMI 355080]
MVVFKPAPFKVDICKEDLETLRKKLQLTRLPTEISESEWGEKNGVTVAFMREMVDHWLHEYDWDREQAKINDLPQFTVEIELDDFGIFDIHFVHVRTDQPDAIPLLFLHGWPGNFTEAFKVIGHLESAGYHIVVPSLPGYGFSSYTHKPGFKNWHHAEIMHQLMIGLRYDKYVVAGGDWGAMITGSMALKYPESVQAIYLTNVFVQPPEDKDQLKYSDFELNSLAIMQRFSESESAYGQVQSTKPRTLGLALHDSPVGMLAWMADKLLLWADAYPWTKDEIITWTLLHYLPGPATAFAMYRENLSVFASGQTAPGVKERYVSTPTGVSAFANEVFMVPRSWAERDFNIVSWNEQSRGGHFPAHERPEELCADMIPFLKAHWKA